MAKLNPPFKTRPRIVEPSPPVEMNRACTSGIPDPDSTILRTVFSAPSAFVFAEAPGCV